MMPSAERVTFTKKKKTVVCPEPLAPLRMRICSHFGIRTPLSV